MDINISVKKTTLKNVLMFEHYWHEDHRGTYEQLYNKRDYGELIRRETGLDIEFLEDDFALSSRHVLRGIHGDDRTWKLITCLRGRYYIAVVNCNMESEDFGKWEGFVLSHGNRRQLLLPPWHGHGYLVMTEDSIFHYKQSAIYEGAFKQFTYAYNDPRFDIWWPVDNPILSKRDKL